GGTILAFEPPTGPGVRVDTHARAGWAPSPRFDSLLAKVIVHTDGDFAAAAAKAGRALGELRIDGVATTVPFLAALLRHPAVVANRIHTRFVEEHAAALVDAATRAAPRAAARPGLAGARIDPTDPLGVLHHGKSAATGPDDPIVPIDD